MLCHATSRVLCHVRVELKVHFAYFLAFLLLNDEFDCLTVAQKFIL